MMDNVFDQIALLLLISSVIGVAFVWLKQPLILAFIAVGIVVGPSVMGIVYSASEIQLLAKIGITLLLFIVGLRLDFQLIRTLGKVSLLTGLGQVVFTAAIGYLIASLLGFNWLSSVYIAVALTFSSTIIIIKLLSDKDEIDSLYGRIAVGFLIVQDIVVILAIITLSSFGIGQGSDTNVTAEIAWLILRGVGLLAALALLARFVFPSFLNRIAASRELLVIFAIAWAVIAAAGAEWMGFSKEVGGFLAGVSLASTDYREAIASRLETLRNFLLLFFFIDLGAQIKLEVINTQLLPATVLSLFVLIGNPIIVMVIMGLMGYRKRTGLMAGLTVAQISEFSLILGSLGVSLGHIDSQVMALITLVGIITIGVSTYLIMYNHVVYEKIKNWLGIFERKNPFSEQDSAEHGDKQSGDVIVFGLGRYGSHLAHFLCHSKVAVLGVDFDLEKIEKCRNSEWHVRYGDAEDIEFVKSLPLRRAKCVLSTIHHPRVNRLLLQALQENRYQGKVAVTIHREQDKQHYQGYAVDLYLVPYRDAACTAAEHVMDVVRTTA